MVCATLGINQAYQIRQFAVAHAPGMPGAFSPPPTSKETAS